MGNIVTYGETQLEPLCRENLTVVDGLILSWLSYLHLPSRAQEAWSWRGLPLSALFRAEYFGEMFQGSWDTAESRRLFAALAASPRFRDLRVMGYRERWEPEREKQFAAVSFRLPGGLTYLSFRGTDSTLVGWKEDFNMAFQYPVPAQEEAAWYLVEAAEHCPGPLWLGGHSKGGNLAVYAAANCPSVLRDRIAGVDSFDGPGFLEWVLDSPDFQAVTPKIRKILPQSSLVGMLLEHQEAFRVVKSDRAGLWQHDPFSWLVEGGDFCYLDALTPNARVLDRTLNEWVRVLPREERERFVDALYGVVEANGITTLAQLREGWQEKIPALVRTASQLDPDTKDFLLRTVRAMVALGVKNFPELFKERETAGEG